MTTRSVFGRVVRGVAILTAAPTACNPTTGPVECDPVICTNPPPPEPPPPPSGIRFRSIWGSSGSDIFVVGDGGAIRHYDGTGWVAHTSGVTTELTDVWGTSATDVFAVGQSGTILHFDGSAWTMHASFGSSLWFRGVWASSPTDVYVVGDRGAEGGAIFHHDGNVWSVQDSTMRFRDVWGSSATDVYAVGVDGALHFDGTTWSYQAPGSFFGVSGSSASNVFAVGSLSGSLVARFDGMTWTRLATGHLTGVATFDAVWVASGTGAFAIGGPTDGSGTQVLYHDGAVWSSVFSSSDNLSAIWGSSASDVYAVGADSTIIHWDGVTWRN